MSTIDKRGSTFSQIQLEHGLHQAVALAAMTLLINAPRAIMNTGFVPRQKGLSTDALISLMIGAITCIWTTLVIVSGLFMRDRPCRLGFEECAARLAYAPWMMQILFLFWLFAWFDELLYLRSKAVIDAIDSDHMDPESRAKRPHPVRIETAFARLLGRRRWRIWKMECSQGSLNWLGSTDWRFRWALYVAIGLPVFVVSYGAIRQRLYTVGLLSIVGLVLFIVGAAGANRYASAPHIYTADTLRVMLHTRHREGTVDILPSKDRGFDAVWSPKIEYEHRALDEATDQMLFSDEPLRWQSRPLSTVLAAFNSNTILSTEEIRHLASWLYELERNPLCRK